MCRMGRVGQWGAIVSSTATEGQSVKVTGDPAQGSEQTEGRFQRWGQQAGAVGLPGGREEPWAGIDGREGPSSSRQPRLSPSGPSRCLGLGLLRDPHRSGRCPVSPGGLGAGLQAA